ncbi:SMC5-SMC6 complex localization factor protein 2 [Spea bombifrons]|uniref:SMC5-SMC6 complex localization factor protein 2 n=1 Tax=Spea bombifrons TaxID=233779 RepID=UPI00234A7FFF|nr:SMC5-SMC6 complex localization factor protein 2 [Spea bombifrons]
MAQRVLSCRQTKGGTQERPRSGVKEGTSGPRNQTITNFFKPSQNSDLSTLNSPHKRSNESLNLLSSGVEAKKTPSKRRRIAVGSPTKSPIMEAFLQKGKTQNRSLVSKAPGYNSPYGSDKGSEDRRIIREHKYSSNVSSSQTSSNGSSQNNDLSEYLCIGKSKSELLEHPNSLSSTSVKEVTGLKSGTFTKGSSLSRASPRSKDGSPIVSGACNVAEDDRIEAILGGLADFPSAHPNCNAAVNGSLTHPQPTKNSLLERSSCSKTEHSSSKGAFQRNRSHKRLRYSSDSDGSDVQCSRLSTDDDEEEELQPLEEILSLVSKPLPPTPQKSSTKPDKKTTFKTNNTRPYVNSLDKLVKEKIENERLADMEKKLNEDLERGLGMLSTQYMESSDEGELEEEHKIFMNKYSMVSNTIPDEHPGEEIFCLEESGNLFTHCTLDLRNSRFFGHSPEENLIFSCDTENQILLATEGFLSHLYKFQKCPVFLMKWLFQMSSVHPSFSVSHRTLNTLMEITCNALSSPEAHSLWTPTLLDLATVFVNMGVNFGTLFPLPHLQPTFGVDDLLSAVPECKVAGKSSIYPLEQIQILEMHITCVVKFVSFCTAVHPESFDDREALLLLVMVLKIYLEKRLRHILVVDLHGLVKHLLQNIKDWDTKMSELCLAVSQLSTHHHNFVTLVQLIPASDVRGRQVRRRLSLIFIAKLLDGSATSVPTDYDSQMLFLCHCFVHMKPTSLVKEMLKNPENNSKTDLELEYEAYYLTSSLLNLMTDASTSDENPSAQRKYVQKLCTALEKHIKCDIHEHARFFYRTQVKDLVARIYGKWQELLHYSRPNQGKLHDYWEPVHENSTPGTSQE